MVSLGSPEDARSGTVRRVHPECWCEAAGSAKTGPGVISEDEEQLQTSRLMVLNSPALASLPLDFSAQLFLCRPSRAGGVWSFPPCPSANLIVCFI